MKYEVKVLSPPKGCPAGEPEKEYTILIAERDKQPIIGEPVGFPCICQHDLFHSSDCELGCSYGKIIESKEIV